MALNPKQEEFCSEYCANGYKIGEAYKTVYGTEGKSNASVIFHKPEVQEKIAEIRRQKLIELQIDADRVTEKLAEIAFSCKGDEYYKSADQLKALDILSKTLGMQKQKIESKQEIIEVGIAQ